MDWMLYHTLDFSCIYLFIKDFLPDFFCCCKLMMFYDWREYMMNVPQNKPSAVVSTFGSEVVGPIV